MSERMLHRLLAVVVFVISFGTYLLTMAGTVSFWDCGEFIATSHILGIPHPPGTPLYVLVGRIFAMLPLPLSIAERVNFLSVFFGAFGVLMAYLVMVMVMRYMYGSAKDGVGRFVRYAGPFVGAMYLAFSDTYWKNATEAEVYALSAFVMGFCTLLALKWYENPAGVVGEEEREALVLRYGKKEAVGVIGERERESRSRSRTLIYMIIYLCSLGIGFHLGTIIVYGGVFLLLMMVRKKAFSNFEILVFTFGMAVLVADMTLHRNSQLTVVGLVIFAILVVWSTISEGKFALAATGLFVLGISVHLYLLIRSGLNPVIDENDPETWKSLYFLLRREQYPPIDILKRKASFVFQLRHFGVYFREQFRMMGDVLIGSFNVGKAAVAIPVALGVYGMVANYFRERRTWMLNFAVLALNTLGLIVFLNFSDHEVRERDYFYGAGFYYFSIFMGIGAGALLMSLVGDVRRRAEGVSRWVVPLGVFLIVCSVLPARYHWFTHDRSRNYIAQDYAYNMLAGLEPDAVLFTNGDNDTFPLWYIQAVEKFRTDVRVINRQLLNTNWYIKQLRDEEPKVPITLNDREIEMMRPRPLKGGGVAWKSDLALQHIIRAANWKTPIYIAVTVPAEFWQPYEDYLEMQGMVRRLVPRKDRGQVNEFMVARNFDSIFRFRGIFDENGEIDDSIYKDEDVRVLFRNFGAAVWQLGEIRGRRGDYDDAIRRLEVSYKLDPTFPYSKKSLGYYYVKSGKPEKAIAHFERMIRAHPREGEHWIALINIYETQGKLDQALEKCELGITKLPNYRDLYGYGLRIEALLGDREGAKAFVRRWLAKKPDDQEFQALLNGFDRFLMEEFGLEPEGAPTRGEEPHPEGK
jgi:tetratricopeptide (TPR) repeat protein